MKLKAIRFTNQKIRKLQNLELELGDRLTAIGGLNGIGKSTILGYLANCSGVKSSSFKSYFGAAFQSNFQELFHLDEYDDYQIANGNSFYVDYEIDGKIFTKRCSVSRHTETSGIRFKLVPRTLNEYRELGNILQIGHDAKVNIPTLYLGMGRMTPMGEHGSSNITLTQHRVFHEEDKEYLYFLFKQVIDYDLDKDDQVVINHDLAYTKKSMKVPKLSHNTLSISLGQDSLSSIFTALASFHKLKRENTEYKNGILIIDEIDAGLHHIAQLKLIKLLKSEAKKLNLQIIFTTHSLTIFKELLTINDRQISCGKTLDKVLYLHNTKDPKVLINPTYLRIKNNQLSSKPSNNENYMKVYLEDTEAVFFLKKIFEFYEYNNYKTIFGTDLQLIALKLGCETILQLEKSDDYFKSVVIILDNDVLSKENYKKIINSYNQFCALPSSIDFDDNTKPEERTPEAIIYNFLNEKLAYYNQNQDFWNEITSSNDGVYDYDFIRNNVMQSFENQDSKRTRELLKNWFNLNNEFINQSNLIQIWCRMNKQNVDLFIEQFKEAINFATSM